MVGSIPIEAIQIAYTRGNDVSGGFAESLLELMRAWGPYEYARSVGGPLIAAARNSLIRQFLEDPTKQWMIMLDTDMVFSVGAVEHLLRVASVDKFPIVAGLAFAWNTEENYAVPVIHKLANPGRPELGFVKIREWPRGNVLADHTAGAACFVAHRSVFERVRDEIGDEHYPWFREDVIANEAVGEDMVFWHRVIRCGITPAVDTSALFEHDKIKRISERDYDPELL